MKDSARAIVGHRGVVFGPRAGAFCKDPGCVYGGGLRILLCESVSSYGPDDIWS